jgi:hypothetical protein
VLELIHGCDDVDDIYIHIFTLNWLWNAQTIRGDGTKKCKQIRNAYLREELESHIACFVSKTSTHPNHDMVHEFMLMLVQ